MERRVTEHRTMGEFEQLRITRPWRPTREQFLAYLAREVELAIENIKRTGSSELSSAATVFQARQLIHFEGK